MVVSVLLKHRSFIGEELRVFFLHSSVGSSEYVCCAETAQCAARVHPICNRTLVCAAKCRMVQFVAWRWDKLSHLGVLGCGWKDG